MLLLADVGRVPAAPTMHLQGSILEFPRHHTPSESTYMYVSAEDNYNPRNTATAMQIIALWIKLKPILRLVARELKYTRNDLPIHVTTVTCTTLPRLIAQRPGPSLFIVTR